ncbi:hypothetical protein AX16_000525 [Volvariella volvacea WC 439]|nr:hypothetical protein AX16_000525 [Volvariella volvacea WC 439]
MLQAGAGVRTRIATRPSFNVRRLTTPHRPAGQPNPRLNLDSSLRALLRDVDISLVNHQSSTPQLRELEVLPTANLVVNQEGDFYDEPEPKSKKSPAAQFGSQRIGAVTIPVQLARSVETLINESDKPLLHSDAKRLFHSGNAEGDSEMDWNTHYGVSYRSRIQASRHSDRDGTAFASIALPAHYSAILSVLDHVKRRLEPSWRVNRVIDWGAGTGSGLWASMYSFQNYVPGPDVEFEHREIANSTVSSYLGIDKRDGLVSVGKKLLRDVNLGDSNISWQKTFREENKMPLSEGHDVLALSAFMLTTLTPLARKALVKEMWESGAHVIVLLDHNTPAGFDAIAEAREYLLKLGRKELEDPAAESSPIRGSHAVAPCPHDQACPLHHPGGKLVCGFSQRLQRPSFIRKTKHSGVGHEDVEYSYVVIRRGSRPQSAFTTLGRLGEVGIRALAKEAEASVPVKELRLHDEGASHSPVEAAEAIPTTKESLDTKAITTDGLDEALRQESYQWPRLVFPPLKKSGHIILDSCTAEGKIMRMTIPKSQGKQPFYDARKSSWGDLFPHPPKNAPQERFVSSKVKGDSTPMKRGDIGKRKESKRPKSPITYEGISESLKTHRKESRRDRFGLSHERE